MLALPAAHNPNELCLGKAPPDFCGFFVANPSPGSDRGCPSDANIDHISIHNAQRPSETLLNGVSALSRACWGFPGAPVGAESYI
jgi:hypothetical protein